jgi:hypothetical protein
MQVRVIGAGARRGRSCTLNVSELQHRTKIGIPQPRQVHTCLAMQAADRRQTRPAERKPSGDAISRVGHWWMALL